MNPSEEKLSDSKAPNGPGPLILRDSGLFFTASAMLPKGIKPRDVEGLARGLIEEQAPLPIEQTSWGFLTDSHKKPGGSFLYYAATRQSLFGNKKEAAEDLRPAAILPTFVALSGLRFPRKTWVFLEEADSLSAALFEEGSSIPTRVVSRFSTPENHAHEAEGEKLRRRLKEEDPEADFLPGNVRVSAAESKGKGAVFHLERKETSDGDWVAWKKTGIEKENRLRAADIRDRETIGEGARVQTSAKRITRVAALIAFAVMVLGLLEILQIQRGRKAIQLAETVEARGPLVERLQGIESIAKSLERVFEGRFEPFDWMMVLNAPRPETIHFSSFALDDSGKIQINGQAPEVKALNDFIANLQEDPRLRQVSTGDIETDEAGVRFSLRAETGNLGALPSEPKDAEPDPAPADESTEEGEAS